MKNLPRYWMKIICIILFLTIIAFYLAFLYAAEEDVSISILNPSANTIIAGKIEITVEPFHKKELIEKVEIYVDRKLVATISSPPYKTLYDFGVVPAEHSIRALGYINGMAKLSDALRTKSYKLSYLINVKLIEIHTSVFNKKGVPVRGLSQDVFTVYDNNVKQDITHFQKEKVPLNLCASAGCKRQHEIQNRNCKRSNKRFYFPYYWSSGSHCIYCF